MKYIHIPTLGALAALAIVREDQDATLVSLMGLAFCTTLHVILLLRESHIASKIAKRVS